MRRRWRWLRRALAAAGVSFAALTLAGQAGAGACGKERWTVKTLQDRPTLLASQRATVAQLTRLTLPPGGDARLRQERQVYTVSAKVVAAKLEADGDIHLVIADSASPATTMIVEFPDSRCAANATRAARTAMASAQTAFLQACGGVTTFGWADYLGRATITGVLFHDRPHGQVGVAANAAELHPVLAFRPIGMCRRL